MASVILFGRLQDLAGWRERRIDAASVSVLKSILTAEDAALGAELSGPSVAAMVNRRLERGDCALETDDEVAFLPPVSGG